MTTFNANRMQSFALEISDREIYNDIRAECDITQILALRPDATPEFFQEFEAEGYFYGLDYGETTTVTVEADETHSEIAWQELTRWTAEIEVLFGWTGAQCEALGGYIRSAPIGPPMCFLPSSLIKLACRILSKSSTSVIVEVENLCDYKIRGSVYVSYMALTSDLRFLKLRSIDEISMRKYGRRVMDLKWPLGQHPVMMQSMIDLYKTRYSEPVSMAEMTLEGIDAANVVSILKLRMDEKHRFNHPRLDMVDQEFFVNHITGGLNREGTNLLSGTFSLEQVRAIEKPAIFTWDVSAWDDGDIWG